MQRPNLLSLALLVLAGSALAVPAPASASADAPSFSGPVIDSNFPDPCLVKYLDTYFVFATKTQNAANETINIQIAQSLDFNTWTLLFGDSNLQLDALPDPPSWVDQSTPNTWAPDVSQLDDGTFIMYFSAATKQAPAHHCVGAALAPTILGPYTPLPDPLFCPLAQGGAIDASGFKDWTSRDFINSGNNPLLSDGGANGQRYVVYKVDGNSLGPGRHPTPLILQAVGADGVTPQGESFTLLDNLGASDDNVVEAPSLVKSAEGEYILFFSSGNYAGSTYTVSYAVSNTLTGGYTRQPVLLKTGSDSLYSPGGADILYDAKHIVFHADKGTSSSVRQLYVGEVQIEGANVSI